MIMNHSFNALLTLVVLPLLMLLTSCNSEDVFESMVKLERIDIVASPITTRGVSELTLAKGNKQPFEAVGFYSDGSSRALSDLSVGDWHTSDRNVGHFDEPGVFIGAEVGSTTVTATKDDITSNTVNVEVTAAVITAIQVTPATVNVAKGQTQQLTADATYSDGTSSEVTSSVTWTSDDTATVTSEGLLSGAEVGSTTLTAIKDGITSNTVNVTVSAAAITAIKVKPATVNVAKGQTQQLTATTTYSDGTFSEVTSSVTWTSDYTNTATVTSEGLLSGAEVGSTTLTAIKDGITSNTVNVTVSAAAITAIKVKPATVNVAKGQTQQLTATTTYSDGTFSEVTNSVTWTSDYTNTAMVTSEGLLSGAEVGSTTLTAIKDGITSNTVNVTVSAAFITAIQVTPATVNVMKGQTQQLTADATYSDGTSSEVTSSVTWMPDDPNTATVTSGGLLSGVEVGSTTVTATKDNITSNTVDVNVCDLAGPCLDIFDTGDGTLFTNSPSVAYLDSIVGSVGNDGTYTEMGYYGPVGDFYLFNWNNANTLCTTYNTNSIGGRTNWRLATKDELKTELYDVSGNMFIARGWPTYYYYRSATPDGPRYYAVSLYHGIISSPTSPDLNSPHYASCVSEP